MTTEINLLQFNFWAWHENKNDENVGLKLKMT